MYKRFWFPEKNILVDASTYTIEYTIEMTNLIEYSCRKPAE